MTEVRRYRVNKQNMSPSDTGNVIFYADYEIAVRAWKGESEAATLIVNQLVKELKEMRDESAWKLAKRLAGRILTKFRPNPNAACHVCESEHPKTDMRRVSLFGWVCPKKCYDAYVDWATWGDGFEDEERN